MADWPANGPWVIIVAGLLLLTSQRFFGEEDPYRLGWFTFFGIAVSSGLQLLLLYVHDYSQVPLGIYHLSAPQTLLAICLVVLIFMTHIDKYFTRTSLEREITIGQAGQLLFLLSAILVRDTATWVFIWPMAFLLSLLAGNYEVGRSIAVQSSGHLAKFSAALAAWVLSLYVGFFWVPLVLMFLLGVTGHGSTHRGVRRGWSAHMSFSFPVQFALLGCLGLLQSHWNETSQTESVAIFFGYLAIQFVRGCMGRSAGDIFNFGVCFFAPLPMLAAMAFAPLALVSWPLTLLFGFAIGAAFQAGMGALGLGLESEFSQIKRQLAASSRWVGWYLFVITLAGLGPWAYWLHQVGFGVAVEVFVVAGFGLAVGAFKFWQIFRSKAEGQVRQIKLTGLQKVWFALLLVAPILLGIYTTPLYNYLQNWIAQFI